MNPYEFNRALERCESFSEFILMLVVGFPPPFTFLTVATVLFLAGVGFTALWVWLL